MQRAQSARTVAFMSLKLKFGNIAGVTLEQRMVNLLEKDDYS